MRSLVALLLLFPAIALAATEEPRGARLEAEVDGVPVLLPLVRTDATLDVRGDLASVVLTQTFEVPAGSGPVNARYIFPLPPGAAVHGLRFTTADQVIVGEIRRKEEAEKAFAAAKQEGKQAALLTHHRPDVFTQEVANLVPGMPVKVELRYAHVVEREDGDYVLHFPMVVGPRFLPHPDPEQAVAPLEAGKWLLPAGPPLAPPSEIDPARVGVTVRLQAGVPIRSVESPTHAITVLAQGEQHSLVTLTAGRTIDNRDLVIRYRLAGESVAAGITTFADDRTGIVSLLLEPPALSAPRQVTPREVVFVLDCSGSMAGAPLEASKRLARKVLSGLAPTDHFRVIRFSDSATGFAKAPVPATAGNVAAGLAYLDGLESEGGTDMQSGITAALAPPVPAGAIRLVLFLTDGYIGNDVEVVRLVQALRGEARLFSFGIGSSVNRYLIQELARSGAGTSRIVLPGEDPEEAADLLANRLEAPLLTDVSIDWGLAKVRDVSPALLPDLFLGQAVRVMARFDEPGAYRVTVRGKIAGQPVRLPIDVLLPALGTDPAGEALPVLWARGQIEDRMVSYLDPGKSDAERATLAEEVTELGLQHRLVTRWTSFVAVARKVVVAPGAAANVDVAAPLPAGTFGQGAQPSQGGGSFGGSAAPEPATLLALGTLGAAAAGFLRRRRGRRGG